MAELRKAFRPEFLNRIDETILFKPLTLEEITQIVDLLLADLNKRLADRRVTVTLDEGEGMGGREGLRPGLRRAAAEAFPAAPDRDEARPRAHQRRGRRGQRGEVQGQGRRAGAFAI
jgi:hypothetical protein